MQILEASPLGLRAARLSLVHPNSDVTITLLPMVHLGEAAFFQAVYADARTHDAVLVEGLRSPVARHITRSYRWSARSKHLGLVVQPRLTAGAGTGPTIIHADLSTDEFEAHWRSVPLYQRLLVYLGSTAYGMFTERFGAREALANGLSLDDLASRDSLLSWTPHLSAFGNALLSARDQRLVRVMNDYLEEPARGPRRLAIVYGAEHMRAVLKELTDRRRYHCAETQWLTVFALETKLGAS